MLIPVLTVDSHCVECRERGTPAPSSDTAVACSPIRVRIGVWGGWVSTVSSSSISVPPKSAITGVRERLFRGSFDDVQALLTRKVVVGLWETEN